MEGGAQHVPFLFSIFGLVLDGTTGLNMLPQAREFNEVNSSSPFLIE